MVVLLVVSPDGHGLSVTQVVVAADEVWTRGPDGQPKRSKRGYRSLDDAEEQNSRATTTALRMTVADLDEAKGLLGKPPPEA